MAKQASKRKGSRTKKKHQTVDPVFRWTVILAVQNILIALIDKIILMPHHVYGAPIFLTIILWAFILKERYWAFIVFEILTIGEAFLGIIGAVGIVAYILRSNNPAFCIIQTVLSISYVLSVFGLRRLRIFT